MPYRITVTRMQSGKPTGSVIIEVPDAYRFDRNWGVQVPDPTEPSEELPLFDESLLDAAARGDFGLKVVGFDIARGLANLGASQEGEPSGSRMSQD